jgi:hypothetical protein
MIGVAMPMGVSPTRNRRRVPCVLRPRKPLTKRELLAGFAAIEKRLLGGGDPFSAFVMRRYGRRLVVLLGASSTEYAVEHRRAPALQHLIGTYDGNADLGAVWDDLCEFDRDPTK